MHTDTVRASLAHARLVTRLREPRLGADAERRALFLRHLTDHGPATVADLLGLTDLQPTGGGGTAARVLADMWEEGLVVRRREPSTPGAPGGRRWRYALPGQLPDAEAAR